MYLESSSFLSHNAQLLFEGGQCFFCIILRLADQLYHFNNNILDVLLKMAIIQFPA